MRLRIVLRLTTISTIFLIMGMLFTTPRNSAAETDNTNRCNSITLENAATILVVSIDDLQKMTNDIMISPEDMEKKTFNIQPCNCSIRSKSNILKGINYIIYEYNEPGQARIDFNKMQNDYGTISKVDIVPDIGDETFWVGDNRFQRMVSIKGDVVVDVLRPKEFELQKEIITLVLSNY